MPLPRQRAGTPHTWTRILPKGYLGALRDALLTSSGRLGPWAPARFLQLEVCLNRVAVESEVLESDDDEPAEPAPVGGSGGGK